MSLEWLEKQMAAVNDDEVEVRLPSGGDFVRGFAGQFTQNAMYKLYTTADVDLKELGIKYDVKIPTRNEAGIFWYWFQRPGAHDNALAACKAIDWRAPNNVWRWEMMTSTMLNYSGEEDVTEKFGEVIALDVDVTGLLSTRRTELHLLFLPSLVQALGVAGGIIPEIIYNYDNLIFDPESVNPEYCQRMVGEIEGKDTKYEEGELWQARTEIWAAFGEENPKAWTANKDPKTDTSSAKLSVPLALISKPGISLWSRVTRIAAPRMPSDKEKEKDQFPFGMNVVSEIWPDKETAMKALEVDSEAGGHPEIPGEWAGTPVGDFRAWVVKYIADNYEGVEKDKVIAAVKKNKALESSLALTADELVPWIEYVWE
jgi:hypothetical protein